MRRLQACVGNEYVSCVIARVESIRMDVYHAHERQVQVCSLRMLADGSFMHML
jgi:hypothetical protein